MKVFIDTMRAEGHAAVVSGAGPSVLVLSNGPGERLAAADLVARVAPEWRVLTLAVDIKGASVVTIPVDSAFSSQV